MDDQTDIAELFRRHVGAARALAIAVTGDPALADDVVQEAFIRSAGRLSRLRDPDKFGAYLHRAVIHTAASQFRRGRAERRALSRFAAQKGAEPTVIAPSGLAAELVAALSALPPRQRTAVAARYLLDWSEAQTADAMGCRVGTVKSLTSRGLATLRLAIPDLKEDAAHE
jgi:RNA polymerase sigma-70 factor (sigma-E family)